MKVLNKDFYAVRKKYKSGNTGVVLFEVEPELDENGFVNYSSFVVLSVDLVINNKNILTQSDKHIWLSTNKELKFLEIVEDLLKGGYIEFSGNYSVYDEVIIKEVFLKNGFFNDNVLDLVFKKE